MTTKPQDLFILGAPDPEMSHIETLLQDLNQAVCHATVGPAALRVAPGTAYQANGFVLASGRLEEIAYRAVLVECAVSQSYRPAGWTGSIHIDHHRPGDPGFDLPPEQYWEGSSIGQVCNLLGVDPTPELRMVAAADHCLGAAYKGKCPGVNVTKLAIWRAEERAAFQRRHVDDILEDVHTAIKALHAAPESDLAPGAADLRSLPGGTVAELPEASVITGKAAVALVTERDGRKKVVLLGASPEQVLAFRERAPGAGLVGQYDGGPNRGFAGAYLP